MVGNAALIRVSSVILRSLSKGIEVNPYQHFLAGQLKDGNVLFIFPTPYQNVYNAAFIFLAAMNIIMSSLYRIWVLYHFRVFPNQFYYIRAEITMRLRKLLSKTAMKSSISSLYLISAGENPMP